MTTTVTIVTNISVKKVLGKLKPPMEKTYLMRVFGIAHSVKTDTAQYGEYTALLGQFRAVNLVTGDVFGAGKCFLPDIALNLVVPAINKEGTNGVEFAFNIGIMPADNAFGYEYCCDLLMEAGETDPLEIIQKKLAALPAPDKKKKVG